VDKHKTKVQSGPLSGRSGGEAFLPHLFVNPTVWSQHCCQKLQKYLYFGTRFRGLSSPADNHLFWARLEDRMIFSLIGYLQTLYVMAGMILKPLKPGLETMFDSVISTDAPLCRASLMQNGIFTCTSGLDQGDV
jgi:hypothetical protein